MNGLFFLAPAGLLALAALAIPLLIHLFSRSRGKRVLVGNIALYRQAQPQRVTQLKLVQWLLLLLRLLLLALAALLLAGLARKGLETLPGDTAYVTPAWLEGQADAATVLEPFDNAFVLGPAGRGLPGVEAGDASDPWSLLAERLAAVRHTGEVQVFARGVAGQFPVAAPPFGATVRWQLTPGPADPVPPERLMVRVANAPGREGDAAELQAALDAIAAHREVPLTVERGSTEEPAAFQETEGARRVMIWLGDGPAPRSTVEAWGPGTWLEDRRLADAAPASEAKLPRFPQLEFPTRSGAGMEAIPADDSVLWWTGDGRPLLRETLLGDTRHLRFEDRLGGDGLTAEAVFPEVLLRLILGEAGWSEGVAHAPADPSAAVGQAGFVDEGPNRPLAPWLALAMAVLFLLERWLSERRPRRSRAAPAP